MTTGKEPSEQPSIHIVGAGLVGSLLATMLAKRGFRCELYERRPDLRRENISAGRSINLALSTRGLHALGELGLEDEILSRAIPMRGRMVHTGKADLGFQSYGTRPNEFINSVSRGELNKVLLSAAEDTGRVRLHFNRKVEDLSELGPGVVFGTDGSASAIRKAIEKEHRIEFNHDVLAHGYKELTIPPLSPSQDGRVHRMEKNALHIWPRSTYMLIALPNFDGSFTCTLFLQAKGPLSFESLKTPEDVSRFFEEQFPDVVPLIPGLTGEFFANPTGSMVTIKGPAWHLTGQGPTTALLVGDAAHAIVPFFGQGMNCGFEDVSVLGELMDRFEVRPDAQAPTSGWHRVFEEFTRIRKPHSDAIADMAVENFYEMRDKVALPEFQLRRQVEKLLAEKFPGRYLSRYQLVTFTRVPYRDAYDAGLVQAEILDELCNGVSSAEEVNWELAAKLIDTRL